MYTPIIIIFGDILGFYKLLVPIPVLFLRQAFESEESLHIVMDYAEGNGQEELRVT